MIVKTNQQDLITYLEDSSNSKGKADCLYLPRDPSELTGVINQLKAQKIAFTASAGRTGTTGGCLPKGGVIISLEGLKKIIDIDPKSKTAKLEAGVSLAELESEANKFKLTLRASPTENLALVGGVISTAASGLRI